MNRYVSPKTQEVFKELLEKHESGEFDREEPIECGDLVREAKSYGIFQTEEQWKRGRGVVIEYTPMVVTVVDGCGDVKQWDEARTYHREQGMFYSFKEYRFGDEPND